MNQLQNTSPNLTPQQHAELSQMDQVLAHIFDLLENETPRALELVEQILAQTQNETLDDFQRRRAYALLLSSRLSYRHMNFHHAVAQGLESLAIYELLDDITGMHEANYLLGIYFLRLGDNVQAMDNLMRSIDYAEQIDYPKGIGSASLVLGNVFRNMRQFERSLERLNYAMKMKQKAEDVYGQAVVMCNQARTLAASGRFDEALSTAMQAIQRSKVPGSLYLTIEAKLTLGDVYSQAQRYDEAIEQFERCLTVCREHSWLELEISTTSKVGQAYLGVNRIDDAIEILQAGLIIAREQLSTYIMIEILTVLIKAYEVLEDYQNAYIYLQQLHSIQHEQIESERSERLRAIEQNYQMRMTRQELSIQKQRTKELEERARADFEYFQQINRLRDEFLSAATHDLKNPLASIRTSLFVMRHKFSAEPEIKRHVDSIDHQVHRMADLISDMLELAKLETGRLLNLEIMSIQELIEDVIHEYQEVANYRLIQISYLKHPNEELIAFDQRFMKRALGNLLSNAIKYSPENGEVIIETQQDDHHMIIELRDNGIGIDPVDLPHIFERFYRVNSSHTLTVEGTGLGLSIVKSIIEQHRGSIEVDSQLGVGTTFRIILPNHPTPSELDA